MSSDDINPEGWTQKELLKHVYREIEKLVKEVQDLRDKSADNTQVVDLTKRVTVMESRVSTIMDQKTVERLEQITTKIEGMREAQAENRGRDRTLYWALGAFLTLLSLALRYLG